MADLTAEMVQRGRGPSSQEVAKRRGIAREMRSARERLTSTSGLERAFDTELLRLYAQYRVGAGIPLLILALMVAGASSIWVPAVTAAIWAAGAIAATTLMLLLSRRFLRQAPESLSLKHWGRAFVAAEFGQSAAWAMLLLVGVPEARTFALFGLVIVAAVTTMLAATVPVAALAGLVPLMLAALSLLIFSSDMDTMLLVAMTVASQLFFAGSAFRR